MTLPRSLAGRVPKPGERFHEKEPAPVEALDVQWQLMRKCAVVVPNGEPDSSLVSCDGHLHFCACVLQHVGDELADDEAGRIDAMPESPVEAGAADKISGGAAGRRNGVEPQPRARGPNKSIQLGQASRLTSADDQGPLMGGIGAVVSAWRCQGTAPPREPWLMPHMSTQQGKSPQRVYLLSSLTLVRSHKTARGSLADA